MKFKLIMSGLAALSVMVGTSSAYAQDAARDAIAERLAPVGQLCLQGQDCGSASAPPASSGGSGDVDGEGIYNNVCMACHETGAAGAPIRGDEAAWSARTEKGFTTLLDHAMNGFNAMPARGGNPNLSDEEMQAAVAYMVEPVMEVPELGGGEEDAAPAVEETPAADESEAAAEGTMTDDAASGAQETEAATASNSGLDGEALYTSLGCVACHASGVAGAPLFGSAEAWAPRIEQGKEALYQSAFNGKGVMPPRGGSQGSDEEIMAVIDYMVSQAQ